MNENTEQTAIESTDQQFDQGAVLTTRILGVGCPRCHVELRIGEVAGCEFAGCPQCRGMLFQQDAFGMLINHLRATTTMPPQVPTPIDLDELMVRSTCPACVLPLETHAYGGPGNSVIDTCIRCGLVWFDEGELDNLVRAPGKR